MQIFSFLQGKLLAQLDPLESLYKMHLVTMMIACDLQLVSYKDLPKKGLKITRLEISAGVKLLNLNLKGPSFNWSVRVLLNQKF